jgi:hypothetical protein
LHQITPDEDLNMNNALNRNGDKTGRPGSLLRRMAGLSRRGLASFTPAGPGSLATGQAASRRLPAKIHADDCAPAHAARHTAD